MRQTWKEVGLGLLNLLAVVAVVVATQPLLQKYLKASGAAVLVIAEDRTQPNSSREPQLGSNNAIAVDPSIESS